METVIPPSRCGSTSMEVWEASFSIHRASHRRSSRRWVLRKNAACWSRHTLIPFMNTKGSLTFDSSERVGVYSGSRMMSWPCRLSSAARALSRRQLPQYILAAPAVNASIFIHLVLDRTNCSKTRHVDLNVFILDFMAAERSLKVAAGIGALWGSLVGVPSGSGRLSIGPPPRRLSTCPTSMWLATLLAVMLL